jgi:hypothetical protein
MFASGSRLTNQRWSVDILAHQTERELPPGAARGDVRRGKCPATCCRGRLPPYARSKACPPARGARKISRDHAASADGGGYLISNLVGAFAIGRDNNGGGLTARAKRKEADRPRADANLLSRQHEAARGFCDRIHAAIVQRALSSKFRPAADETMNSEQSANAVVMIRPLRFYPNPETALDNAFQGVVADAPDAVAARVRVEFDGAVTTLSGAGVTVHVFEDTPYPAKPDAVFPNNWFSTHRDGRVALYPMYAPSRRPERRLDLIASLRERYHVTDVVDYSPYEKRGLYLEGTGSLVLDHIHRLAYVSLSKRADREPLQKFCADFDYEPVTFQSSGDDGRPIYHTNVMLCVGTQFVLVGLEMIDDPAQRETVRSRFAATGKTIIALNRDQIANFAGNALELQNGREKLLVLSVRAASHLTAAQRTTIERFARLLPLSLPTIELAGGSARCMMATVHLPLR